MAIHKVTQSYTVYMLRSHKKTDSSGSQCRRTKLHIYANWETTADNARCSLPIRKRNPFETAVGWNCKSKTRRKVQRTCADRKEKIWRHSETASGRYETQRSCREVSSGSGISLSVSMMAHQKKWTSDLRKSTKVQNMYLELWFTDHLSEILNRRRIKCPTS